MISGISRALFERIMTPSEIEIKAKNIKTPGDLLDLINRIRKTENKGFKHEPLTAKGLARYSNHKTKAKRYRTFYIPKKSGGKREINAPMSKLNAFLWPINLILQSIYEPKACVMGFTHGRSVVDNAKVHLGQNYILNLDLENFFTSIREARVWKRLQLPPFNFPADVASKIAALCSTQVVKEDGSVDYVLPQGAPTSPILTNIICEKLDRRLLGVAERFNLRYTRYADDITFSSMHSVLSIGGEAYNEIVNVINEQGFSLNEKKTRLLKKGSRQEVTGLILSEKVNAPRKYIEELDVILYVWKKFGYDKAYAKLLSFRSQKAYQRKGMISLESVISGKLNYLKMVKGEKDKVYIKYASEFAALTQKKQPQSTQGLYYLATYKVADFETLFNTSIRVESNGGSLRVKLCLNNVENTVRLTMAARKDISQAKIVSGSLLISLCRDTGLFWLIHKREPEIKTERVLTLSIKKILEIWEADGLAAAMREDDRARRKAEKKAQKKKEKKVVSDSVKARLPDPFALSAEDLLQCLAKRATMSPTEGIPGIPSDLFTITLKDDEQDS